MKSMQLSVGPAAVRQSSPHPTAAAPQHTSSQPLPSPGNISLPAGTPNALPLLVPSPRCGGAFLSSTPHRATPSQRGGTGTPSNHSVSLLSTIPNSMLIHSTADELHDEVETMRRAEDAQRKAPCLTLAAVKNFHRSLAAASTVPAAAVPPTATPIARTTSPLKATSDSREISIFREALQRHRADVKKPPSQRCHSTTSSAAKDDVTSPVGGPRMHHDYATVRSSGGEKLVEAPSPHFFKQFSKIFGEKRSAADEHALGAASAAALLRDQVQHRLSTVAASKGQVDVLAATLDDMIAHAIPSTSVEGGSTGRQVQVARPPSRLKPENGCSTALRNCPQSAQSSPRRQTSGPTVPLRPAPECLSTLKDSTSLVQNHRIGLPHVVDGASFVATQARITHILFAGWEELCSLVRNHSAEQAVLLSALRAGFEAVISNANQCAQYYMGVVDDITKLRLDEVIKSLTQQVAERDRELERCKTKMAALEVESASFAALKDEQEKLQQRQKGFETFLRDQLQRNALIMRMATQGTGGVIPAHVVTALLSGGTSGAAAVRSAMQRRSTRGARQSMLGGGGGPTVSLQGGDDTIAGEQRSASVLGADSSVILLTPDVGNHLVPSPTAHDSNVPPPFFVQATTGINPFPQFTDGLSSSVVGDAEDSEAPFTIFESVETATQTHLDDAVDAQLMTECQGFYTELDRAATLSQTVCRVVYGTTDFYNPTECCDSARSLMDEIAFTAHQLREQQQRGALNNDTQSARIGLSAVMGGDISLTQPPPVGSSQGSLGHASAKANIAGLMGYFDLPKAKIVKLLAYGATAAKELRLRLSSLTENESFRRAVEWRAPKGPRDPCRLCSRLGPLPEDIASIAENAELKERITSLQHELEAAAIENEKMSKRIEFERQISQTRADEIEALHRAKKAMISTAAQADLPAVFSVNTQTDVGAAMWSAQESHIRAMMFSAVSSGGGSSNSMIPAYFTNQQSVTVNPATPETSGSSAVGVKLQVPFQPITAFNSEVSSYSPTPVAAAGSGANTAASEAERSPFPTSEHEWAAIRGTLGAHDGTFLTTQVAVSSRRRSSIEVTFDPEVVGAGMGESPSTSAVPRALSAERRMTARGVSQWGSGPGDGADPVVGDMPPLPVGVYAGRRGSEFTTAALRYRDAFLTMGRAATAGVPATGAKNTPPSGRADALAKNRISPLNPNAAGVPDALTLPGGQIRSHGWALRMLSAVYRSKYNAGQAERIGSASSQGSSSTESHHSGISCSKHFTDFLRQNFGTKALIDENAASFLKTIHALSSGDARFALFARLFSDEFHREVYRTFLTFSACIDQTLTQFDTSAGGKRNDELPDPSRIPLECVLHCIDALFSHNERIISRDEFCHLLAEKAIEMSVIPSRGSSANAGSATPSTKSRKASVISMSAFDSHSAPAFGTPIESSDSFSKYRTLFHIQIPKDATRRVVLRIGFLTFLCEIARPYVTRPAPSDDTPISGSVSAVTSRANSATFDF